jgi:AraC-like DNA-binding protein
VRAPFRHALVSPLVAGVLDELDVGVSLWELGSWYGIHALPDLRDPVSFELEHGAETERFAYNVRCLDEARRTKTTVVAEHAGYTDLFVPIVSAGRADGVLVTGPLERSRPTSAEILSRWRFLTGRQGQPSDPEFAHYLEVARSVLVLDGPRFALYRELVECFARLMASEGDADKLHARIRLLGARLGEARLADRTWAIARAIVDERTSRSWASPARLSRLRVIGLSRCPEHVAVGLVVSRERGADPVDEAIRREAFQRACVELARRTGEAASGKVGGHGVTLLCAKKGSAARVRRFLLDLAEQASSIAKKRFALDVHWGLGALSGSPPAQYQAALAAAESALTKDERVVVGTSDTRATTSLGGLRRDLAELVDENPDLLPARFDRYLETARARTGHALEPLRAHAEAAFERIAEVGLASGALDAKSFSSLAASLEKRSAEAATVADLFAAYRGAVGDVVQAAGSPRSVPREHGLRRALEYMRTHYAEAPTLERVARIAGFSPSHFSRLFHAKEGVTYERHLTRLRVERAQQLLSGTGLSLGRVAQLSGLSTRHYLGRVFRRWTGETPLGYRRRARSDRGE